MSQTLNIQTVPAKTEAPARLATISPLVWILAAGLVVRLLLLGWHYDLKPYIEDERQYCQLAANLANHGEFAFEPGIPATLRPPLYPAVVATAYKVFGADHYLLATRVFQHLLSLVNVIVIFYLASEAFSRRVGLWASGLYCFYPSMVVYGNLMLTEVLFTFWLCLLCLAVVRFYQRNAIGYLALAGVLIGLGALTRSILWMTPPFLALFVLFTWRAPLSRRLLAAALMVAAFAITIAPWSVRNTRVEKTFVAIDTMGGRNFMMGNYEHTPLYRAWDAIAEKGERGWDDVVRAEDPSFQEMTQGQKDKRAAKYGLDFARRNPGLTLKRDLIKTVQFWSLERELIAGLKSGEFEPRQEATSQPRSTQLPAIVVWSVSALILGGYVLTMFTGVFGMLLAPPSDRRLHWFFLLVIVFIWGMHSIVFSHSRYHLPLMPLVLMYSASAIVNAGRLWQSRREGKFWLAVGVCVLLVAGWAWVDVAVYLGMI